jgi:hypothetical protein
MRLVRIPLARSTPKSHLLITDVVLRVCNRDPFQQLRQALVVASRH